MKKIEKQVCTHIRLPVTLNKRLDKAAKKHKTLKSDVIRYLLDSTVDYLIKKPIDKSKS